MLDLAGTWRLEVYQRCRVSTNVHVLFMSANFQRGNPIPPNPLPVLPQILYCIVQYLHCTINVDKKKKEQAITDNEPTRDKEAQGGLPRSSSFE